ncbi:MAG: amino acid permease [Candidatus Omnitrophica bacterium]|nr:amino acid permease [Candidatus Omnitrophota bacterium]MDD5487740.1 amino acid permease [Candidatus Omnitrophota bacterium]
MGLKKKLKLLDVFCIASGAMISSGLFVLPGLAHAQAGPAVVLSYFFAGLLAMTGMLSQAELASAMPKAGGDYFYVTRSMGPALGTIDGVLTWMSISLKSAFALIGMAAFIKIIAPMEVHIIAVALCAVFVVVNVLGVEEAGKLQVGVVIVLLILLVIYIADGIKAVELSNLRPFMPYGWGKVFSTAGFVFVSYGGLLKVASVAEEVKDPSRTVPRAMVLSLVTVSILYSLVVLVTSGVLANSDLNSSIMPITDGAAVFMGEWGRKALSLAAILAFVSTANAGIMSAARYPFALSRDKLLPRMFSNIHERFGSPYVSILATGLFMVLALFLDLNILVKAASTVLIFTFIFSCLCVVIMRESGVRNYRPKFKCPFYPWIQILGVFGFWLLVVNMGQDALLTGTWLFAAGLLLYWFYGRVQGKKDYALLYLVKKMAARELESVTLETELKDIIRERDNIERDRFDRIIEESVLLDIEEEMTEKKLFELVSEKISARLDIEKDVMLSALVEREKQASTVLMPGLAVPHIIIEGTGKFSILLARCRGGVTFPGAREKVHIIFVIAGTRDERSFHLKALSAIAELSQNPHFFDKWIKAGDPEELRDMILLGQRKRHN